jgi:hypothetical protein
MGNFFVWRVQRFTKIGEVDLPWPYVRPYWEHVGDQSEPEYDPHHGLHVLDKKIPDNLIDLIASGDPLVPDQPHDWTAPDYMETRQTNNFYVQGRWQPIGAMLAASVFTTPRRTGVRSMRRFIVTPPVYMFADLEADFGDRDMGSLKFWVQPDVYEVSAQLLQGDTPSEWLDFDRNRVTENQDALDALMVALDSFLEKRAIDPRFGGAHPITRKPKRQRA